MKPFVIAALLCLTAQTAAAELPSRLTSRGTLTAAIVPNYPPLDLRDPATNALTGFDVELGTALAQAIGLKIEWQETNFEQMLSSVRTGRVDIILSGMSDLPERQGTATFVDYLRSGSQFFTQASRAADFPTPETLCGHKVGASRRTALVGDIKTFSDAHCLPRGRPEIQVIGTEGSADARTQLRQGRIDAAMQGGETLPYIMAHEPGVYAPIGEPVRYTLMGLATGKDETGLQTALADALKRLIADGTYARLLDKWSLAPSAITEVTINGGH